jgi:Ca2+-binding RTX toxin-like protein
MPRQWALSPSRRVVSRAEFWLRLTAGSRLVGGARHDELGAYHGTQGVRVLGRGGPDLIRGMRGDQRLHGDRGADLIYGGAGDDVIHGGAGDDRVVESQGRTVVFTGPGRGRSASPSLGVCRQGQLRSRDRDRFPNSSATNWTTGTNSYQVFLHCSGDSSHGYLSIG